MDWDTFYGGHFDWSPSTIKKNISLLKEIGPGDEVVDVIMLLDHDELKVQLLNKAIQLNVKFTYDDILSLNYELDEESLEKLEDYTGLNKNNPNIDETKLSWNTFYEYYTNWDEEIIYKRALLIKETPPLDELFNVLLWISDDTQKTNIFKKFTLNTQYKVSWNVFYDYYYNIPEDILQYLITHLSSFGTNDEITEAIQYLPTDKLQEQLYNKAVKNKVKFTRDQLIDLGKIQDDVEEDIDDDSFNFNLLSLLGLFGLFSKSNKTSRYCDGDCLNCPPHYGNRYGRWYYGHGHTDGCERCGNGGRRGMPYRD